MPNTAVRFQRCCRSSLAYPLAFVLSVAAAIIAGCGNNNTNNYGTAFFTVSASAPSNFASYRVLFTSLTLTRSDGTVIGVSGASETVDFAQLAHQDLSEMFGATIIPLGTYTSATLTVDYTTATIAVINNGVLKTVSPVLPAGTAAGAITVVTKFDPKNPLVIPSLGGQRLALDFNIGATSALDAAGTKVVVRPYFTVTNSPPSSQRIRIRGPLISYNTALQTYSVYVRPFHDIVDNFGTVTLFATPTTAYAIDNENFTGADGLNTITNLTTGTVLAGYTTYAPDAKGGKFTVSEVYAGTALESGLADNIEGNVIARSGNTLTLRGATLSLRDGSYSFRTADSLVTVGTTTVVSRDGVPTATGLTAASISVGQHIIAQGQASVSTAGVATVNATTVSGILGRVRLASTRAWGSLTSGAAGSASIDLQAFDDLPASVFNFAGTGATSASDASAADYVLDTGSVDLTGIAAGTMYAADGIVTPFGSAPPDFTATAVAPTTDVDAVLVVQYTGTGTTTPFSSTSSTNLVLDLTDPALGTVHSISVGPNVTDLSALASSPSIVADATTKSQFSIGSTAAGINVYTTFSDFLAQLNADSSKAVGRFTAVGRYDSATNTFTAKSIDLVKN